ncbi:GspH/FimT family pseudopilin [Caenimonas terrae]|uniref:Type II secretion system protein H n=1 Tax=Caenimonas terrae TaxID=696074 RepID=A0ABW0NGT7_9BURK
MNTHQTPPAALPSTLLEPLRRPRRHRGFTLIELMIVVAVATVLLGFGVPSMTALTNANKLTAASNAFLSSLRLARSEAFKRNGRVVLCKSRDGVACNPGGGWEQGWLVFHDANGDGVHDDGETVIQRGNPLPASLRFTGNSTVGRYVSFVASGSTRMMGGGFQAGTITVCNQSLERSEARQIVLNAVGRPRVQKVALDSCA